MPRNLTAFERSQTLRALIRDILGQHSPLFAPLTAKHVLKRLDWSPQPSLRAVRWHMQAIREAEYIATAAM